MQLAADVVAKSCYLPWGLRPARPKRWQTLRHDLLLVVNAQDDKMLYWPLRTQRDQAAGDFARALWQNFGVWTRSLDTQKRAIISALRTWASPTSISAESTAAAARSTPPMIRLGDRPTVRHTARRGSPTSPRILRDDLRPYRDELVISTKAGYDMWPGPYGDLGSRKYLLASLDQSLTRMGLDYVDIFYSHRLRHPDTPLEETMGALHIAP